MKNLLKFQVVLIVFSSFSFAFKAWEDKSQESKECFASFLRNMSLLELSFPADNYNETGCKCEKRIKDASNRFAVDTVIAMHLRLILGIKESELERHSETRDCVLDVFKKYNVIFLYLKGITFFIFNLTDIANFAVDTKNDHAFLVEQALSYCKVKVQGDKFDKRLEEKEASLDLCKVQYLSEKGLLDSNGWKINMSSSHGNDCADAAHELEVYVDMAGISKNSSFFGLGVPSAETCIYDKFKNLQMNMKRATIKELIKTELDSDQRNIIRQHHIELESEASEIILDCLSLAMTIASVSSNNKFLLRVYDE